ncbi:MAG: hypothetical protein IPL28_15730 [Chloroflexi bacterium]|nr:hypothetical protein [Chloroflexota bacterium]
MAETAAPYLPALEKWRAFCVAHGLIGQDPTRYAGYGFGNISQQIVLEEGRGGITAVSHQRHANGPFGASVRRALRAGDGLLPHRKSGGGQRGCQTLL